MSSNHLEAGPATKAVAVTPNDSTNITPTVALYIGAAGTLKVTCWDGTETTFGAVSAGVLPLRVLRVWSTGTSATSIVALY
jgi:hypothetical protein